MPDDRCLVRDRTLLTPPTVVDVRFHEFDVYIGRRSNRAADPRCHHTSIWANPFVPMGEWARDRCVEWYENLMRWRLDRGGWTGRVLGTEADGHRMSGEPGVNEWWDAQAWREAVLMLEGKRLGCWCKGKRGEGACHGDVLVRVFEELADRARDKPKKERSDG